MIYEYKKDRNFGSGRQFIRLLGSRLHNTIRYNPYYYYFLYEIRSVADPDPGSSAFLTPGSGVLDG
jgi:hypothetical protein